MSLVDRVTTGTYNFVSLTLKTVLLLSSLPSLLCPTKF